MSVQEEFFNITQKGMVSLKPEYRGRCAVADFASFGDNISYLAGNEYYAVSDNGANNYGSKYDVLPKNIVIPDTIDDIAVSSLAPGMFAFCDKQETIAIPSIITVIPDSFVFGAYSLRQVGNVSQVTSVGAKAFKASGIESIFMPKLGSCGEYAFEYCANLKRADLGTLETAPSYLCNSCCRLESIVIRGLVNVGIGAFNRTRNLKTLLNSNDGTGIQPFVSIYSGGFMGSLLEVAPYMVANTTTSVQLRAVYSNPLSADAEGNINAGYSDGFDYNRFLSKFWSTVSQSPHRVENPLVSTFSQMDNRTIGKKYAKSGLSNFSIGCLLHSILHAKSAVSGCSKCPSITDMLSYVFNGDTSVGRYYSIDGVDLYSYSDDPGSRNPPQEISRQILRTIWQRLAENMWRLENYIKATLRRLYGTVSSRY